jgi:hypothetical protein
MNTAEEYAIRIAGTKGNSGVRDQTVISIIGDIRRAYNLNPDDHIPEMEFITYRLRKFSEAEALKLYIDDFVECCEYLQDENKL